MPIIRFLAGIFQTSNERERRLLFVTAHPLGGPVPPSETPPKPERTAEVAKREGETAQIRDDIGEVAEAVRAQAKDAITEAPPAHDLYVEATKLQATLATTHDTLSNGDRLLDRMGMSAEELAEHHKINRENLTYLAIKSTMISKYTEAAELLDRWQNGKLSPEEFTMELRSDLFSDREERFRNPIYQSLVALVRDNPNARRNKWATLNESQRVEYIQQIDIKPLLLVINEAVQMWNAELKKIQEYIAGIPSEEEVQRMQVQGSGGSIEFYSILHAVKAVKHIGEAFKNAWNKWSLIKESSLAHKLGNLTRWVKYGEEANQELEEKLEHDNEAVVKSYMEFLEHDQASFEHIVSPHGLLWINRRDGNKFRAVLKYMASKGWIFEQTNVDAQTAYGFKLIPGETVPSNWDHKKIRTFLQNLEREDGGGQKKAMDNGYSRVENMPDIPPMIEVMNQELKRNNFWACWGITKRIWEKGKVGEASAWACTSIMRAMRDSPLAMRYMPKGLFDKLGNIGISSSAWMTTFFKLNRDNLVLFQKGRVSFDNAGDLANAIDLAEQDITAAHAKTGKPPLKQLELDRMVAKLLASQSVEINGTKLSVYSSKYDKFRKRFGDTTTTIKPADTDDDYYNVGNKGSEVILLSKEQYGVIFHADTTGDWPSNMTSKCSMMMDQIVKRYDQLQNDGPPDAFRNYVEEQRTKLEYMMGVSPHPNSNGPWPAKLLPNGRPIFIELYRRNLITRNRLEELKKKKQNLAAALLEQIDAEEQKMVKTLSSRTDIGSGAG